MSNNNLNEEDFINIVKITIESIDKYICSYQYSDLIQGITNIIFLSESNYNFFNLTLDNYQDIYNLDINLNNTIIYIRYDNQYILNNSIQVLKICFCNVLNYFEHIKNPSKIYTNQYVRTNIYNTYNFIISKYKKLRISLDNFNNTEKNIQNIKILHDEIKDIINLKFNDYIFDLFVFLYTDLYIYDFEIIPYYEKNLKTMLKIPYIVYNTDVNFVTETKSNFLFDDDYINFFGENTDLTNNDTQDISLNVSECSNYQMYTLFDKNINNLKNQTNFTLYIGEYYCRFSESNVNNDIFDIKIADLLNQLDLIISTDLGKDSYIPTVIQYSQISLENLEKIKCLYIAQLNQLKKLIVDVEMIYTLVKNNPNGIYDLNTNEIIKNVIDLNFTSLKSSNIEIKNLVNITNENEFILVKNIGENPKYFATNKILKLKELENYFTIEISENFFELRIISYQDKIDKIQEKEHESYKSLESIILYIQTMVKNIDDLMIEINKSC